MKDCDKFKSSLSDEIKNSLIDEFYNEVPKNIDDKLKYSAEASEFKNKLNSTNDKVSVLNEDIFDLDIDTLSMIEQGEFIRENRKAKKEFILFILSSFIILSLYAIVIVSFGSKILIISQIVIVSIIPWVGIATLLIKKRGSEV